MWLKEGQNGAPPPFGKLGEEAQCERRRLGEGDRLELRSRLRLATPRAFGLKGPSVAVDTGLSEDFPLVLGEGAGLWLGRHLSSSGGAHLLGTGQVQRAWA